jgi:hypothetical protein
VHSRLLLVPAAIVVAASAQPASGFELQSLEAAQAKLAAGRRLTPADFRLTPEQHIRLQQEYRVPSLRPAVKAWRIEGGGWLFLDQVYGLNDIVTYLVAIGDDGEVDGLEVLVCAEGYCDIFTPEWRATLVGRTHGKWEPTEVVPMISGATLSCTHVGEGVKKLLAIHARFLPT